MSPRLLVLADDLTGAADVGGRCAAGGIRSRVLDASALPEHPPTHAVLIVDTDSRHAPPNEAAETVRRVVDWASSLGVARLIKKTDSTGRGNLRAELGALAERGRVVYFAAYPAAGRTVREGVLCVDGVPVHQTAFAADARRPMTTSHLPTLLRGVDVELLDGTTDDEEQDAARRCADDAVIAAGPAGFCGRVIGALDPPRESLPTAVSQPPRLALLGSRHPVTQAQVAAARGWERVELADTTAALARVTAALAAGRSVVVGAPATPVEPEWVPRRMGRLARGAVHLAGELVLAGGETARQVLRDLGVPGLDPIAELAPGVVRSLPVGGCRATILTKSGGFGPEDLLARLGDDG